MTEPAEVFEMHYKDYLSQLSAVNLELIGDTLGLPKDADKRVLPFYNKKYWITDEGFIDESGNKPVYGEAVVLFKYILLCPDEPRYNPEWSAFKDFKKDSHFTNVNFFNSDTVKRIEKAFTGKLESLKKACVQLGGAHYEQELSYDLSMTFTAFPRISLLLLFNDGDEEFPAKCTVLFQKHTEYFLDSESIAITSSLLAKKLVAQSQ